MKLREKHIWKILVSIEINIFIAMFPLQNAEDAVGVYETIVYLHLYRSWLSPSPLHLKRLARSFLDQNTRTMKGTT